MYLVVATYRAPLSQQVLLKDKGELFVWNDAAAIQVRLVAQKLGMHPGPNMLTLDRTTEL